MLTHLSIRHFAIVDKLELNFNPGMTVLTGETGAGKSILIDALQLTLGERADTSIIRNDAPDAEISAIYDINSLPTVLEWLKEQSLDAYDECIIRRVISKDGRSRAYINGRTVPIMQLRDLGWQLINIHGQHQHQSLLKPEHQRTLLDSFANHPHLLETVRNHYTLLQQLKKDQQALMDLQSQPDKLALLQYQIQEIDELRLQENELETLEREYKELVHAEQWISLTETALQSLVSEADGNALTALNQAIHAVSQLKSHTAKLNICHELLTNSMIQLQEAIAELDTFKETLSLDPTRLATIDQRLSLIHQLARKHRIQPQSLLQHQANLLKETTQLIDAQSRLENLDHKMSEAKITYYTSAETLSQSRKTAAKQLEKMVTEKLRILEMPNGLFKIQFAEKNEASISPNGIDEIEYLVSTNPGLDCQPLRKIASGGELSRISLAIQVITAQKMTTPTLIFDEVDAGISGKTAEIVGKLLKTLAKHVQVLCVTHLPQIAAQGHHHLKVTKIQTKSATTTHIQPLSRDEKIQELARMVGGAEITQHALLHAKTMLENA